MQPGRQGRASSSSTPPPTSSQGRRPGLIDRRSRWSSTALPSCVQRHRRGDGRRPASSCEIQQKAEQMRLAEKVNDHLSYIPGLMVSVTVKVNTTTTQAKKHECRREEVAARRGRRPDETTRAEHRPRHRQASRARCPTREHRAIATGGRRRRRRHDHDRTRSTTKFENVVAGNEHRATRTPAGDGDAGRRVRPRPASAISSTVCTASMPDVKDPTDATLKRPDRARAAEDQRRRDEVRRA